MDKMQSDEILKAIVSAYVWVASSDGVVDESEWIKYQHVILESPFATQFNQEDIGRYFKDFVAMFETDFARSMEMTKSILAPFRTQKFVAEEILRMSRAAVVGDARLSESEEVTLGAVAQALDIPS